jgi:alpha-1,6-mannosyltransferase
VVYATLGILLLALLAVTSTYGEWVSDSWIHAGTLVEVARHPLHPVEPLTGEHVPFAYFSPWAMSLGWLMHLTGWSVWVVLTLAGLIGTTLMLLCWYRLVRALTPARWAPVLALPLLLLLWGTGAWFWSGFPVLGSLSVGFVWPSVFAAACWFETWRTALRVDRVGRVHLVAVFLVLPGLMLLVHPFTAVIAAVSVLITLAGRLRRGSTAVPVAAAAAVASGLLALAWPWISLPAMIGDQAGFDTIHHALYRQPMMKWALLPLIVPPLVVRVVRDRRDPLFWTAVVCAAGCAAGGLTGSWSLARLGPGVALPGQAALAVLLAEGWQHRAARRRPTVLRRWRRAGFALLAALSCVALVVGGYANAWALARAVPGEARRARAEAATDAQARYPQLGWIAGRVHAGDTAVSNFWWSRRELPAYGLRSVRTQWPSPAVPDEARRAADEDRILGWRPATRAQRAALLSRYRVRWIVWHPTARTPMWPYPGARLVGCGPDGTALLRVDPRATTRPRACR